MSIKIDRPKLLIVEGRDEELFFTAALRDYLGLTDIQVMPIGGKTNIWERSPDAANRFRHDLTAVRKVRASPPPMTPMPAAEIWRWYVASWPEAERRQWAQLTLDHQLAGFDPEQAEWRAFLEFW
jgi:hypothetical protein